MLSRRLPLCALFTWTYCNRVRRLNESSQPYASESSTWNIFMLSLETDKPKSTTIFTCQNVLTAICKWKLDLEQEIQLPQTKCYELGLLLLSLAFTTRSLGNCYHLKQTNQKLQQFSHLSVSTSIDVLVWSGSGCEIEQHYLVHKGERVRRARFRPSEVRESMTEADDLLPIPRSLVLSVV